MVYGHSTSPEGRGRLDSVEERRPPDGPGDYAMVGHVEVSSAASLDSAAVAQLAEGDNVKVLEVITLAALQRVRARIAQPPGWITLVDTRDGYRWAEKKTKLRRQNGLEADNDSGSQSELSSGSQGQGRSKVNDEGAPVSRGKFTGRFYYYCGRNLGKALIPGSNGRCGPHIGPQCPSCIRYGGGLKGIITGHQYGRRGARSPGRPEPSTSPGPREGALCVPPRSFRRGRSPRELTPPAGRAPVSRSPRGVRGPLTGRQYFAGKQDEPEYLAFPGVVYGGDYPLTGTPLKVLWLDGEAQRPHDNSANPATLLLKGVNKVTEGIKSLVVIDEFILVPDGTFWKPGAKEPAFPHNGINMLWRICADKDCIVVDFFKHGQYLDYWYHELVFTFDEDPVNDDGVPVSRGMFTGRLSYYCGRSLGKSIIPGSNGTCGPHVGPQCPSCLRFQPSAHDQAIGQGQGSYFAGKAFSHGSVRRLELRQEVAVVAGKPPLAFESWDDDFEGMNAMDANNALSRSTEADHPYASFRSDYDEGDANASFRGGNNEGNANASFRSDYNASFRSASPKEDKAPSAPSVGLASEEPLRALGESLYTEHRSQPPNGLWTRCCAAVKRCCARRRANSDTIRRAEAIYAAHGGGGANTVEAGPSQAKTTPRGECNDDGVPVAHGRLTGRFSYYCGRDLGKSSIPGSNGFCGPHVGPQCTSCQRFQAVHASKTTSFLSVKGPITGHHYGP